MTAIKVLFAILISLGFVLAISNLGEACRYTGDCREGYCIDGICKVPAILEKYTVAGTCNFTGECLTGFCYQGQCILPSREEYQVLSLGIKSGCAGIIQNCTGIWCAVCDFTWLFLIVGSGVAAFVGRRRGRILPLLLFIVPLGMGILLLPLLGFILALIEIAALAIVKKQK